MADFSVKVHTSGVEWYAVEAASAAEAEEKWERGDVDPPYFAEVWDAEVVEVIYEGDD